MEYKYLGDRHTDPEMKNIICIAIRRKDGKCVRGKNGSMLVQSSNAKKFVVVGRLLRKLNK